jgi:Protein of unknown function (DUF3551)
MSKNIPGAAMPIGSFVEPGAFEVLAEMAETLDAACKELQDAWPPEVVREIIATRIIAAIRLGERDPARLLEAAVRRPTINPSARRTSVRLPVLSFPFIAIALLSQTHTISAQSSNEYAWCAITSADGRSCYYMSQQQCLDANSGLSFFCVPNPRYRPPQVIPEAAPSASNPAPVASPAKRQQSQ